MMSKLRKFLTNIFLLGLDKNSKPPFMKPAVFLGLIFLFLFNNESTAQNITSLRQLGKLNFDNNADYVLTASVEDGKFTYTLADAFNSITPIFSFALYSNTLESFIETIKAKSIGINNLKVPSDEELSKYFFFFTNQNSFLIENRAGDKAMEMAFNDSLKIYSFNHPDFSYIKEKDVFHLLKSLFYFKMDDHEYKDSEFDFSTYDTVYLPNDSIKRRVFNQDFEIRLTEIKDSSPKVLKWEKLYIEIQYRYYEALIDQIEIKAKKVNEIKNQSLKGFKAKKDSLQNVLTLLSLETINLHTQIANDLRRMEEAKRLQTILNEGIPLQINISVLSDSDSLENPGNRSYIDSLLSSNIVYAEKLPSKIRIIKTRLDSGTNITHNEDEIIALYKQEFMAIQRIYGGLRSEWFESTRIDELERSIELNQILSENAEQKIFENQKVLKTIQDSTEIFMDTIQSSLKSELEGVNRSNKFLFIARNIQMEINKGYLENLIIVGEASIFIEPELVDYSSIISSERIPLKFVNEYPIGISAKKDIERLRNIKLYSKFNNNRHYELRLGDVITNIEEILALDRTDYSPKDGAYQIDLLTEGNIEFQKSDTKEILQMKIFSDFVGLNGENPNGLIQLEVDREIPLITKRITRPYVWIPFRFLINRNGNLGFFNFFRPGFVLSKVEDNNRYLVLTPFHITKDESSTKPEELRLGTSTLEIKQFERFSVGADLNLLLYNIPYGKSTFLLNAGMHFGRTDLAQHDSVASKQLLPINHTNTYQPSAELLWRITGDERYGFELSYGINWLISDQLHFTQRSSTLDKSDFRNLKESDKNYGIQRFTLSAYLNLDSNSAGRLFFRYRSNSELGKLNNNYAQLQIGYTTYLTKRAQ